MDPVTQQKPRASSLGDILPTSQPNAPEAAPPWKPPKLPPSADTVPGMVQIAKPGAGKAIVIVVLSALALSMLSYAYRKGIIPHLPFQK